MKQQIIELKKKLLLVERSDDNLLEDFKIFEMLVNHNVKKTIGKLTDIKEEQFAELVENIKAESTRYINYRVRYAIYSLSSKLGRSSGKSMEYKQHLFI